MRIIIAAVLGLLLINSAGMVQAEKAVIEVPFESHGTSCWYDEIKIQYHCTWEGVVEVFTLEDLQEFKDILSKKTYEQEIEKLNQKALDEIAAEKAKLTEYEKIIIEIERKLDKGIATSNDATLRNLLNELETCQQGMDQRTSHIQTAREFEISGFKHLTSNNVKIDGLLGKIAMSIQECKAQKEVFKLSVGYESMVTGEDDIQYSLSQKYTYDVQSIPFDKFRQTTTNIDISAICDSNQHNAQYKKDFGCLILYDGKTAEEIKLENRKRFGDSGVIGYESELLDNYHDFVKSYGNIHATDEDKKVQAEIAEPISNEWKEKHNFYQNNLE